MIKRTNYLNKINAELKNIETVLFLIGARQVGKSTLLQSLVKYNYIKKDNSIFLQGDELSFENIDNYQNFIEHVSMKTNIENLEYLILDEAQYINNIGLILKILIDKIRKKEFRFKIIVSGSGSLNVFSGITDSLIGRKKRIYVRPFDFEEFLLAKGINIIETESETTINNYLKYFQEYIFFGGYPQVVLTKDPNEKMGIFKNLLNDYIFKDVLLLLEQKEIINFKKFLKLIASKVGNEIMLSSLVEELGVSRYIMEKYLYVVENTFLIHNIHSWKGGLFQNEIKKKSKIYFNDIGMLRYLLGVSERIGDMKGKVVENFVCNQLKGKLQDYQELFYWGTSDGGEVDFIIENQTNFKLKAIEVKSGNKLNIPKSFSNFIDRYSKKIDKCLITTQNKFEKRNDNILFIPYVVVDNFI